MTATLTQIEVALAARFEQLRGPCPSKIGGGLRHYARPPFGSTDCPVCHGLGYLPNCSADALLEVTKQQRLVLRRFGWNGKVWECVLARDGGYAICGDGDGAIPREALARALWAAEKEGAKHA